MLSPRPMHVSCLEEFRVDAHLVDLMQAGANPLGKSLLGPRVLHTLPVGELSVLRHGLIG